MAHKFAIVVLFCAVTGFAAVQPKPTTTTFTAKFEGEGITSSKGLITDPTSTPQVAGRKCCAENVPEQFLYNDVCFCRLFPAKQGEPVEGAPVQVVPKSKNNLAVYNPLYLPGENILNPRPAEVSVLHRLGGHYKKFDLQSICYACETPLPEGNLNVPLAGTLLLKGYDGYGRQKGAQSLPFDLSLNDQMQCATINRGQGFEGVAKITLQCAQLGINKLVTTVIDDVVLVLHKYG